MVQLLYLKTVLFIVIFYPFISEKLALDNSLSFGDNDIVVRCDPHEACDALF